MKAFFAVAVAAVLASAVSAQSVQLETFSTNSDCSSPMSYLYETLCTFAPLFLFLFSLFFFYPSYFFCFFYALFSRPEPNH